MKNKKGWFGQKQKHSDASKKGWDKRNRNKHILSIESEGIKGLTIKEGISPDYYRPTLSEIKDRKRFEEDLKKVGGKKINKRIIRTIDKMEGSPTGYEMSIFDKQTGNYHSHIIVNKDGSIPDRQAILRLMDVESGGKDPFHDRNLMVDLSESANLIYGKHDKGNWKWYLHPNTSDLKDIDTSFSKYSESLKGLKKGARKSQKGIIILARNPEQEKEMRENIGKSFTQKEQKEMGLLFISVGKTSSGSAGEYWSSSTPSQIMIDPKYLSSHVLIHEMTHHHRKVGSNRTGALKFVPKYQGKDRDLEESMTEAETVTREKPFDETKIRAGYYQALEKDHDKRSILQIEDRKKLTGYQESKLGKLDRDNKIILNTDKNIDKLSKKAMRGKRAITRTRKIYPETNISKLKIKGKHEAIDTFHQYEQNGNKLKVQAYNPDMKKVKRPGSKSFTSKKIDKFEWQDGKKVKIR